MSEVENRNLTLYRIKLLALISVFLLPFIAGWLAFYVFEYRPDSKNYGDLVQPVRPIQFPRLTTINNTILDQDFWQKWTFVILDKHGCEQLCRDNLYYLRQMKTALGRDSHRVQNVLVTTQSVTSEFSQFLKDFPKLRVIHQGADEMLDMFALPGIEAGGQPMLYLVDPAANLMMTYPASNDASSVLSDMRRLLKISQIG